ncbi:hypothetical protein [Mycobacterium sp. 050134]|uniref:hypothetical protein n=1 Tax=Mycobacterium sp. 050134 TaxID=3096111 RepID=UPI002ED7AEF8
MSHHKKSLTPEQIDDMINSGKLPAGTAGANWGLFEALTNSDVSSLTTSQDELQQIAGITQNPAAVAVEDFTGVSFTTMFADFQGASGTLDNGNGSALQQISSAIVSASDTFQEALGQQEAQNLWVGKTHDAAIANITESLPDVTNIAMGANALGLLIDAFSHTIFQTQWYLNQNKPRYDESVSRWPNEVDEINQVYDSFAQDVMNTVYAPNITSIASNNPGFSTPASSPPDSSSVPPPDTPPPPPTDNNTPPPPPDNTGPPPPVDNTALPPPDPTPPPTDPSGAPPPPQLNTDLGPNGSVPPPGDPLAGAGINSPFGGSGASGAGLGNFALPSGVPGVGSSDFALPNGGPSGSSGSFPLPSAAGLANPFGSNAASGGSALPGGVPGGPSAPNGAPTSDPFSDISNPAGSSGNFPLPSGTGATNPFSGATNSAGAATNPAAGLSGLGQAAEGLGEPLQQALGAAQGHPSGMPGSGAPGFAPKDLDALGKPGGGAGHGAGGGAGLGSQGRDTLGPAGAPVAAAAKAPQAPEGALARPGGAPLGAAGAGGAPPGGGGGGQRGPGGKEHKANKALRRVKNGELVLGDVDAVVPVIGDDGPEEAEPPQRAPVSPVPQPPRPAPTGTPRRPVLEQRTEVGR